MSNAPIWERRDSWCVVVLAAAAMVAVVLAITPHPVGVFQDDGAYVILAKALAEGDGYRYISLPNAPHGTHFPPLYPLWLAGLWKLGPTLAAKVQLFKFANAMLLGVATALAFTFARRRLGMHTWTAAVTTAAVCICAPLVSMASMVLSEPAFLAALCPILLLAEGSVTESRARSALAAGLAGGALGLLRTLGMFVLPATVLVLLARRRWRDAGLVLLGGAAVLAPWQLWTFAHGDALPAPIVGKYGSYLGWFVDGVRDGGALFVASVARVNTEFTGNFLAGTFGLSTAPFAARVALIAVVLILLAFGAREMWRRVPVTTVFLGIYLAIVIVWPFPPDRFYWAVWPLLGYAFVLGMRRVAQSRLAAGRWRRGACAVAAVALIALYARPQFLGVSRPWVSDIQGVMTERSRAVVHWVNASTGPNDVIATEDDALVYLYTGRLTVPIGAFTPREYVAPQTPAFASATLGSLLDVYPVRWVLPTTWMAINASLDLARQQQPGIAFRQKLPLGAVFERLARPGAGP